MRSPSLPLLAATGCIALLAGCTTQAPGTSGAAASGAASGPQAPASQTPTGMPGALIGEAAALNPRAVITHDQGITTIDTVTGDVVDETSHPGFLRLSNAGDGRHVMVADGDSFLVYDAGIQETPHGDHSHRYTFKPGLNGVKYEAPHAGHIVLHNGKTSLFADGTGSVQVVASDRVAESGAQVFSFKNPAPHHGVAFELADGNLITTQGTTDARSTIRVLKKDGSAVAETTDCPGVHGEAAAKPTARGDVAVFGCENGPIVYRDGAFHKVKVPEAFERSGNLAGGEQWPVVLADYKTDKANKHEHPTRVGLIDSSTNTMATVELGQSYWFRSLARGPEGEALVLTYDGAVQVIDPVTKKITGFIKAIEPWTEKDDWQLPGPAIKVAGDKAYVTDAEHSKLVVIDLAKKAVVKTITLPHVPTELAVVNGLAETHAEK